MGNGEGYGRIIHSVCLPKVTWYLVANLFIAFLWGHSPSYNNVLPTLGNMHVIRARRQYAGRYVTLRSYRQNSGLLKEVLLG